MFFVIAGVKEMRVWVGNFKNKNIIEIFECAHSDGIYKAYEEK